MKCKNNLCKKKFTPTMQGQVTCNYECAIQKVKQDREKKRKKEWQKEKKELREKTKTWKEYNKETQECFNLYIRLRDKNDPCISCERTEQEILPVEGWLRGGIWDAGHYLSRGAYPELRFEELNCHKQCKKCNGGSGKYAKKSRSVTAGYREGLTKKIGCDKVEWLEGPHEIKKYTISELIEIKEKYKQKIKELKEFHCDQKDISI